MQHLIAGLRRPGILACLAALFLQACERIEPIQGNDQGAESVTLTCEGCHTTRSYLRRLAIEDGSGGGGGGG